MALHIKKGDMVEVIAGDYKGATGRVLRVIPEENKVVVQGGSGSEYSQETCAAVAEKSAGRQDKR